MSSDNKFIGQMPQPCPVKTIKGADGITRAIEPAYAVGYTGNKAFQGVPRRPRTSTGGAHEAR